GRNRAISAMRHQRTQDRLVQDLRGTHPTGGPRATNDGASDVDTHELHTAVVAAIDALQPRVREVFLLHLHHGLRAPEIAAMLGIAPATVHSLVYRATRQLAARLKDWL